MEIIMIWFTQTSCLDNTYVYLNRDNWENLNWIFDNEKLLIFEMLLGLIKIESFSIIHDKIFMNLSDKVLNLLQNSLECLEKNTQV